MGVILYILVELALHVETKWVKQSIIHGAIIGSINMVITGISRGIAAAAAAAKSLQSCLTLCDLIDGSPSGSPVPGILQIRTLEWVAISFSNA